MPPYAEPHAEGYEEWRACERRLSEIRRLLMAKAQERKKLNKVEKLRVEPFDHYQAAVAVPTQLAQLAQLAQPVSVSGPQPL